MNREEQLIFPSNCHSEREKHYVSRGFGAERFQVAVPSRAGFM